MTAVTDNTAESRFELVEEGKLAFADYRRSDGKLVIPHVEADPALRGGGAAARLMEGLLAQAHTEGLKVVPLCGYAAAYFRRHKQHQDLLA